MTQKYTISNTFEAITVTVKNIPQLEEMFGEYNLSYIFNNKKEIEAIRINIQKHSFLANVGDYIIKADNGYTALPADTFKALFK